jgi:TonB family protein
MRPVVCVLLAASALCVHADVTIRYHTDSKLLPAAMADRTIRLKGSRANFSLGRLTALADFGKQQITLLDPTTKTFATVSLSQYSAKMKEALPAEAAGVTALFDKTEAKVTSSLTGKTGKIQGLTAAERAIDIAMEIPMPDGMPSSGAAMNMTMKIWTASPEEFLRQPSLRELAAFSLWQKNFTDMSDFVPAFRPMFDEMMRGGGVILRTHMEVRMAMRGVPADAATPPLLEMNEEVAGISTDALEDSIFAIPTGYDAAPFEELAKREVEAAIQADDAPAVGAGGPQAYVPSLAPLEQKEPAAVAGAHGMVDLLVTIDPRGAVTDAEALSGQQSLRQAAVVTVKQWKYRPVMRDGAAVSAYTDAMVDFASNEVSAMRDVSEIMSATERRMQLEKQFPRTPQQILADLEQDSGGGDAHRRYYALDRMAKAAVDAGAMDKAGAYASELLTASKANKDDWNAGNAIHDGNMVLGLVALQQGDVSKAGNLLLEAGRTPGSPQLDSFGPDMSLAKALLAKGESGIVLKYLSLCGNFWKMGAGKLEAWSQAIRDGKTPAFQ